MVPYLYIISTFPLTLLGKKNHKINFYRKDEFTCLVFLI